MCDPLLEVFPNFKAELPVPLPYFYNNIILIYLTSYTSDA